MSESWLNAEFGGCRGGLNCAQARSDRLHALTQCRRPGCARRQPPRQGAGRALRRASQAGHAALKLLTCLLPAMLLVPDAGAAEQACTAVHAVADAAASAVPAVVQYSDINSQAVETGAVFLTAWIAVQLLLLPSLKARAAQRARLANALEAIAAALQARAADGSAARLVNGVKHDAQVDDQAANKS